MATGSCPPPRAPCYVSLPPRPASGSLAPSAGGAPLPVLSSGGRRSSVVVIVPRFLGASSSVALCVVPVPFRPRLIWPINPVFLSGNRESAPTRRSRLPSVASRQRVHSQLCSASDSLVLCFPVYVSVPRSGPASPVRPPICFPPSVVGVPVLLYAPACCGLPALPRSQPRLCVSSSATVFTPSLYSCSSFSAVRRSSGVCVVPSLRRSSATNATPAVSRHNPLTADQSSTAAPPLWAFGFCCSQTLCGPLCQPVRVSMPLALLLVPLHLLVVCIYGTIPRFSGTLLCLSFVSKSLSIFFHLRNCPVRVHQTLPSQLCPLLASLRPVTYPQFLAFRRSLRTTRLPPVGPSLSFGCYHICLVARHFLSRWSSSEPLAVLSYRSGQCIAGLQVLRCNGGFGAPCRLPFAPRPSSGLPAPVSVGSYFSLLFCLRRARLLAPFFHNLQIRVCMASNCLFYVLLLLLVAVRPLSLITPIPPTVATLRVNVCSYSARARYNAL